jgi:hypothetical protein
MSQNLETVARSSLMKEAPQGNPAASSQQGTISQKPPSDKVVVTFLLISGERYQFAFGLKETIDHVKVHVFSHWPKGETLCVNLGLK